MIPLKVGNICEIFRIYDSFSPMHCRILNVSSDWIFAEVICDNGEHNGVSLFETQSVWRVRHESKESLKLFENSREFINFELKADDGWVELLKRINDRFDCINISCEGLMPDDCFVGKIDKINNEMVRLKEYRIVTVAETTLLDLLVSKITKVEAGGEYEIKLHKFYSNQ